MQYNTEFVNLSRNTEGLLSVVNILCYLNLIITILNNINNH